MYIFICIYIYVCVYLKIDLIYNIIATVVTTTQSELLEKPAPSGAILTYPGEGSSDLMRSPQAEAATL